MFGVSTRPPELSELCVVTATSPMLVDSENVNDCPSVSMSYDPAEIVAGAVAEAPVSPPYVVTEMLEPDTL